MPRINLLPWRDAERKERKIAFMVALAAAAVAAAVVTGAGGLGRVGDVGQRHHVVEHRAGVGAGGGDRGAVPLGQGGQKAAALPAAPRISAALEASRRLRVTVGDTAVLVACLPGGGRAAELLGDSSAGASVLQVLAREFLGAGADILLLAEREAGGGAAQEPAMRTVANMARFHRALCYVSGPAVSFLDQPTVVPLDQPRPARGLVVTERELPADTSMTVVRDWVDRVRG